MLGAFAGRIGYVDLTTRRTWDERLDVDLARDYMGSTGLNSRLLADLAGPSGTCWDADNPVIVGVGPLVGTLVPGASRTSITTRSPITGGYGHSNSGSFGDGLKSAGFDHLVVTGIAAEPVVVVADQGRLAVEPADAAWGLDIFDATQVLWNRYPGARVACIGPAGEHQVIAATILTDTHGAFGSSGLGCALGIKRVKALVARGQTAVEVADRAKLTRAALRLFRELMAQPNVRAWRQWGTLVQFSDANPSGMEEAQTRFGFDMPAWLDIYRSRIWEGPASCPGCPVGCKARVRSGDHVIQISCPTGTMTLPFAMNQRVDVGRFRQVVGNAELANRLGISTLWVGQLRQWVCDLIARSILSPSDFDGYDPSDGEPASADGLMTDIAYRRGIGDILAGPIEQARERIGGGAEHDPVRKGMLTGVAERTGDEALGRWSGYSFSRTIDPRGPIAETAYSSIAWVPGRTEDQLRRYCERIGVPEGRRAAVVTGGVDGYDLARMTPYIEAYNMLLYSIGQCQRPYFSRIMDVDTTAALLRDATGIDREPAELIEAGRRILTLQRLFNAAHGLDRAADLGPEPSIDPEAARELEAMLDRYYAEHGWDADGVPTADALSSVGLDSAVDRDLLAAAGGRLNRRAATPAS